MYEMLVLMFLFAVIMVVIVGYSVLSVKFTDDGKDWKIWISIFGCLAVAFAIVYAAMPTLITRPSYIKKEEAECNCSLNYSYEYSLFNHYGANNN